MLESYQQVQGPVRWTEWKSSARIWEIRKVDVDCLPGLELVPPSPILNSDHPRVHLWALLWGCWLESIAQAEAKRSIRQKLALSALFSAVDEVPLSAVPSSLSNPILDVQTISKLF